MVYQTHPIEEYLSKGVKIETQEFFDKEGIKMDTSGVEFFWLPTVGIDKNSFYLKAETKEQMDFFTDGKSFRKIYTEYIIYTIARDKRYIAISPGTATHNNMKDVNVYVAKETKEKFPEYFI